MDFNPRLKIKNCGRYCFVIIDLWPTEYNISPEGLEKIKDILLMYAFKHFKRTCFGYNDEIISFTAKREHLEEMLKKLLFIIRHHLVPMSLTLLNDS